MFVGRPAVPQAFDGLDTVQAQVGGRSLRIVIASDHARGLMGVEDLGDIDGMLFGFPGEVDPQAHRFWMRDVLIPLDIAFFDGEGVLVSQRRMEPCPPATSECPLYAADSPFRWALETEAGTFPFAPGAQLVLPG